MVRSLSLFDLYRRLVHEAGHVVGLRGDYVEGVGRGKLYRPDGWFGPLANHHATVRESVMSFKGEELRDPNRPPQVILEDIPSCAPHPLDVMAVYALYQGR